ncbi:MAG: hypothetical protein KDB22_19610, partial [Planctomycetales bacterium]|nr:hypothetical protein [Planctomycetales bacterium]
RGSVLFRQKPRASAQRLILRKDYVELNFPFFTIATFADFCTQKIRCSGFEHPMGDQYTWQPKPRLSFAMSNPSSHSSFFASYLTPTLTALLDTH